MHGSITKCFHVSRLAHGFESSLLSNIHIQESIAIIICRTLAQVKSPIDAYGTFTHMARSGRAREKKYTQERVAREQLESRLYARARTFFGLKTDEAKVAVLHHLFALHPDLDHAFQEEAEGSKYGHLENRKPVAQMDLDVLDWEAEAEAGLPVRVGSDRKHGLGSSVASDDDIEPIEVVDARMRRMADGHAAQLQREAEKASFEEHEPFVSVFATRKRRAEKPAGQTPEKGAPFVDLDTGQQLTDREKNTCCTTQGKDPMCNVCKHEFTVRH